jgi:hypothetical protein
LFKPTIAYHSAIQLQSSLQPACGTWYVSHMVHYLESLTPGGAWFSDLSVMSLAYFNGLPAN